MTRIIFILRENHEIIETTESGQARSSFQVGDRLSIIRMSSLVQEQIYYIIRSIHHVLDTRDDAEGYYYMEVYVDRIDNVEEIY